MKLVIMTQQAFFVEEDKILSALFDEGMADLHLRKPGAEPMMAERLLSLLPETTYGKITVHDHYYLKNEYRLAGIHIDSADAPPKDYRGKVGRTCSTADALDAQSRARDDLERAYRRFVPEQLLTLLGKQSIQQVDKSTFVSRRMAVMQVHFAFPEPLYTQQANSRLLFDSVNQVIERTSNLATRNGGTVFHFSYDGYDVVMENDSRKVISTAVAIQQEVLAFNEGRVREGMPTVRFHIALDVGDVLLGVVGDSARMEPTTISTSFSVVRELVGLSGRLEARILCTESVIDGAGEYGSRYLGKCWLDDEAIRVYEIFDGDDYSVRKSKSQTVGRFSQGVYALYSGETAQAKRIFLELVHNDPADGGARYYLYLADRMERDPELVCGLNPRRAEQRRN